MAKRFNIHDWQAKQIRLNEHHDDEDFPNISNMSASNLLDILKSNKELYDKVEDYLKSTNEASMTGTGTSITTGNNVAYATPAAFAKKDKWKNKNAKYQE